MANRKATSPTTQFQEASSPTPRLSATSSTTPRTTASSPPTPLYIDTSIWGHTDPQNQNLLHHVQRRRPQRHGHSNALEQNRGVWANNRDHETTSGPLVLGAGYKAPSRPPSVASQAWSEDHIPPKFRKRHATATKTDGPSSTTPAPSMPRSSAGRSSLSFMSQPHFGPSEYQAQKQAEAQRQVARVPPRYPTPQPQPQAQTGLLHSYHPQPSNAAYPPNHRPQSAYSRPPPAPNQAPVASWNGTTGGRARGGMQSGGSSRYPRNAGAVVRSFGPAPTTSSNYKGNAHLEANQSHDIPKEESCSMWITNLPPDCDVPMLLSRIVDCDKVYATVINEAIPADGKPFAAAKVVFWTRRGVERLLQRHQDGLFVFAYPGTATPPTPGVTLNRILARPMPPSSCSRVLVLHGHRDIINEENLRANVFQNRFVWQDDGAPSVELENPRTHLRFLEWRFGSWRCQAENAKNILDGCISHGKEVKRRHDLQKEEQQLKAELGNIYNNFETLFKDSTMVLDMLCDREDRLKIVQREIVGLPEVSDGELLWAAVTVIYGRDPCA